MLTRPPATRRDRGSSLMLMPAAVLVFVILAAICVDFAAVHLGQRELTIAAQGAVNDAVAVGFDESAFYDSGIDRLDWEDASEAALQSLAVNAPEADVLDLRPVGDDRILIEVELYVDTIFAKAVPGGPRTIRVTATATAVLAG